MNHFELLSTIEYMRLLVADTTGRTSYSEDNIDRLADELAFLERALRTQGKECVRCGHLNVG